MDQRICLRGGYPSEVNQLIDLKVVLIIRF